MSASKRQKLSTEIDKEPQTKSTTSPPEDSDNDSGSEEFSGSETDGSSPDTADEIAGAKGAKSKKTMKRKRRATEPSRFGATLQYLLHTDAPSALPLSLKPSLARKRNDEKLELRAKKVLQVEKKEREDKGRITDVIGGWGGESERALRKVAQRGVVQLFNAIQQSQTTATVAAEHSKSNRGTGKPTLPAPEIDSKPKGKSKAKERDNIVGRGKETAVAKDDFFDMIRSGGIVSKA